VFEAEEFSEFFQRLLHGGYFIMGRAAGLQN